MPFYRLNHLIDYLSEVTEFIKIPNTVRKFFSSSDSRSRDAVTRGVELDRTRCLVDSIPSMASPQFHLSYRATHHHLTVTIALRRLRNSVI